MTTPRLNGWAKRLAVILPILTLIVVGAASGQELRDDINQNRRDLDRLDDIRERLVRIETKMDNVESLLQQDNGR